MAIIFAVLSPSKPLVNPVVICGSDGTDWNIIHPLFQRGKLSYLARIVQEASWGVLESEKPTKS